MGIRPIFLFSLPRSGSTLLQRIIATHKDVCTTSECWFLLPIFYSLKGEDIYSEYGASACAHGIQDFVTCLGRKREDFYSSVRNFSYSMYTNASNPGATYFLDKTPRYYLIIDEIAKTFPEGKFIFLFRNPLAVLASMIMYWNNGRIRLHYNQVDLIKGPRFLYEGYRNLDGRNIAINYEKLLTDTDATLKQVFNYLDLTYDPTLSLSFSDVKLSGRLGDKSQTSKADNILKNDLSKWHGAFRSSYRKRFARDYLEQIGPTLISMMNYDIEELIDELYSIENVPWLIPGDIIDTLVGKLIRLMELHLFIKRQKQWKANRNYFLHH